MFLAILGNAIVWPTRQTVEIPLEDDVFLRIVLVFCRHGGVIKRTRDQYVKRLQMESVGSPWNGVLDLTRSVWKIVYISFERVDCNGKLEMELAKES